MTSTLSSLNVLIIEDSPDDAQFIVHELKKQGFDLQFKRIQTEEELNQSLKQENWDIILSDYSMPRFSGTRAFEVLKSSGLDIPFIIISGTVGEDIAVENMRLGVNDYVLKSNMTRLAPAIRREIEAARARKEFSETKKMLSDTEEQLRQSQKMEAIGQLAGGIAHDFNNMLSVMQIYCHKIKETASDPLIKTYVEKMISVQARTAALTKQLLVFSRRQPSSVSPVQLTDVVVNMKEMLESLVGSQTKLLLELKNLEQKTLANESQLEQIIMNLAVNARDAMPKGGTLTVKTDSVKITKPLSVLSNTLPPGEYVTLEISDTGHGIKPEHLKKIFEPFFTTKPAGQGTGLGLSIIYGIIQQSQGGIDVTSTPQLGTTFTIYLPVTKHTSETEVVIPESLEKPVSKTVLLVEDEAELKSLISEILIQEGYRVIEASDGEDAFRILQTPGNKIDLVLTDMTMPKLDGSRLYEQAKTLSKTVPFVYMSGFFKELPPENFDFLEKPFTNQALLSKIKSVLNKS